MDQDKLKQWAAERARMDKQMGGELETGASLGEAGMFFGGLVALAFHLAWIVAICVGIYLAWNWLMS